MPNEKKYIKWNQLNSLLSTAQCSVYDYGDRVGSDAARGNLGHRP